MFCTDDLWEEELLPHKGHLVAETPTVAAVVQRAVYKSIISAWREDQEAGIGVDGSTSTIDNGVPEGGAEDTWDVQGTVRNMLLVGGEVALLVRYGWGDGLQ